MKRFVLAAFCTMALVGFVMAEDLTVYITKVDGSKVTYFKTKAPDAGAGKKGAKAEKEGKELTATATKDVKVSKGGKMAVDIEKGLADDMFKTIADTGILATITVEDSGANKGQISKIVTKGGGGKKKGG